MTKAEREAQHLRIEAMLQELERRCGVRPPLLAERPKLTLVKGGKDA